MKRHILLLCILGNPFELVRGGHQRTILEIINYFKDNPDLEITVITSKCISGHIVISKLYTNITLYEIPIKEEWAQNQDLLYHNKARIYNQIKDIYKKLNMPVSLLHSTYWFSGLLGSILCNEFNLPQIHSVISSSRERMKNGFTPVSTYQLESEDIIFKNTDLIISITEAEYELLTDAYHISPHKIVVIGRTVADCFLTPSHMPSGNIDDQYHSDLSADMIRNSTNTWWMDGAFCYLGRIVDQKGIKEIVRAWEKIFNKYGQLTPPLWLIGGTALDIQNYRDEIKKYVPKLEVYESSHKLYWWGFLSSEGISNVLLKCNVLIMHSGFEPGGRVILEAMAMGTPIIATFSGFGKNYVQDWYNGFQVNYGDYKMLFHYMELFVKNPYLSNMLGLNSQQFYKEISRNWNYYEKMTDLYLHFDTNQYHYSNNLFYKKNRPIKNGLVDAFPFCDIKNTKSDLCKAFSIDKENITYNKSNQSHQWICPKGIIKQYYNRFNYKQLWNKSDTKKVIDIITLYDTSLYSASFSICMPILAQSDNLFSYMLPKGRVLTPDECISQMSLVLKCLRTTQINLDEIVFSDTKECFRKINSSFQPQHKYYSLNLSISELYDAINNNSVFSSSECSTIDKILQLLTYRVSKTQHNYGINYGKSLINHIVQYDSQYYLLPSSDVYFGEIGMDEALTYLDYWGTHNICNIFSHLNTLAADNTINLWIFALLIEQYIEQRALHYKDCIELEKLLMHIEKYR